MLAIETRGLTKAYGRHHAVDGLDMHVARGDLYGFVGRNGAGKSTTMKMMCGLAQPTAGEVLVMGQPAGVASGQDALRIGALIEQPGVYPSMSAQQNLMCKAIALGVVDARDECERLLETVGLSSAGAKRVRGFSMGMRQRLGIALALMGTPDILLLDEPMNGLDPEGVREMRDLILQLNEVRGVTVLISSHVLDQLGRIATRYGVIDQGRMVRELTAEEVASECGDYLVLLTSDQTRAIAVLAERLPMRSCTVMADNRIRIAGDGASLDVDTAAIGVIMSDAGLAIRELYAHRRDIEEFFLELMGGDRRA